MIERIDGFLKTGLLCSQPEKRSLLLSRKRAIAPWLLVPPLMFFAACHSQVHSEVRPRQLEAPSPSPSPRDVASLCESIKDIEVLPVKYEPVPDPAYNALISAGEDAIPCLIRKLSDTTRMKDPRSEPKVESVAVGDTAFFVLLDLIKIDQAMFLELLPPDVRKAYENDGIYGYFDQIDENGNRKKLQDAAVKWYENKYGRSLP